MQPTALRPRPTNRFQGTDLGDEYLFWDRDADRIHVLNGTAREIYLLCDGTRSEQEVAQAFSQSHEVDPQLAQRHAVETIKELSRLGLLDCEQGQEAAQS